MSFSSKYHHLNSLVKKCKILENVSEQFYVCFTFFRMYLNNIAFAYHPILWNHIHFDEIFCKERWKVVIEIYDEQCQFNESVCVFCLYVMHEISILYNIWNDATYTLTLSIIATSCQIIILFIRKWRTLRIMYIYVCITIGNNKNDILIWNFNLFELLYNNMCLNYRLS